MIHAASVPVPAECADHRPDAHWSCGTGAHCSLWWNGTPSLDGRRVGLLGHYSAADRAAARLLLEEVCRELAGRGCDVAIGPMDGSTWRSYRLVTERGPAPPFFLEPDTADEWVGDFLGAGFAPMARYLSTVAEDLGVQDPREPEIAERMAAQDVRIRPIDLRRLDEELRGIHDVSLAAFHRNLLYTPLEFDEFRRAYRSLEARVLPETILVAERQGRLLGFVFAVPDLLQALRGRQPDTLVLKTLAVMPGRETAGLGRLILARLHEAAQALGFRRVIHALMEESNSSTVLSGRTAKVFRRYALFSRELRP